MIELRFALVLAVACSGDAPPATPTPVAPTPAPDVAAAITPAQAFAQLVVDDLRVRTAADLVPGAPARPLVIAQTFPLPYGATTIAVIGLAAAELPVPTQLEAMRLRIGDRAERLFSRDDLATAVRRALADERAAIAAAERALETARVPRPARYPTWKAALRSATYDARLPAANLAGEPSWSFIFEPWREQGYPQVVLDARLGVTLVDGKRP